MGQGEKERRAAKRQPNPDLRPRVISGLVLIGLSVLFVWMGGFAYSAIICAIGAVLYYEWARMTLLPTQAFSVRACAVLLFMAFLFVLFDRHVAALSIAGVGSFVLAFVVHRRLVANASLTRAKWAIAGLFYALLATISLIVVRSAPDGAGDFEGERGLTLMAFLLLTVWATDIAAYFSGRRFGGPRLLPAVSPKKTWAGAIGGVAAAAFVGFAFGFGPTRFGVFAGVLLAMILSVVAQIGDLFESWVKRRYDVKDSSRLIPGHGGFMDRVDGLVAAAVPLALYVAISG